MLILQIQDHQCSPRPMNHWEADDWLRTMEQKFDLIPCMEIQKPVFAAQQLRGAAGAWWANLVAMQPAGIPITWAEFHTAF